jgi:hypothetical protein
VSGGAGFWAAALAPPVPGLPLAGPVGPPQTEYSWQAAGPGDAAWTAAGASVAEAARAMASEPRTRTRIGRELRMRTYRAARALRADAAGRDDYRPSLSGSDAVLGGQERAVGFLVGAAAPFALAIQGGGYDIVAYELTGLVVWWLIAAGLVLGLLPRARPPRTLRVPLFGLIALTAWTVLSLIWTSSQEASFAELARLVGYAGVATLALTTIHRGNWRAAAGGLTTAAAAISLLGLASRLDPGLFAGTTASVAIQGRLSYPLGYWNAMGAWGAMALALSLGWSADRSAPIGRRLAIATTPAIGLSIYLTYSRGAIVALVVALLALFLFAGDRRELITNAAIAVAGGIAAILIAGTQPSIENASGGQGGGLVFAALLALGAMSVAFADALARRRIGLTPWTRPALVAVGCASLALVVGASALAPGELPTSAGSTQSTVEAPSIRNPGSRVTSFSTSRPTIWRQAGHAFLSVPLLGIGPGTFNTWWARHEGEPALGDAHSLYLGTLAELGLPGFLALGAIILGLLGAGFQAMRRLHRGRSVGAALMGATLAFCVQAAGDWLWKVPAIVALAAGSVIALTAVDSPTRASDLRPRLRIGLAALAVGAGLVMIPGAVSTQLARDSASLASAGQHSKAIDYARTAIDAEPWSASAHAALASAELAAHHLGAAGAAAARAVELEPDDWSRHLQLGVIQYRAGDRSGAIQSFEQAAILDDRSPSDVKQAVKHPPPAPVTP